jgi:hypothetical protein
VSPVAGGAEGATECATAGVVVTGTEASRTGARVVVVVGGGVVLVVVVVGGTVVVVVVAVSDAEEYRTSCWWRTTLYNAGPLCLLGAAT